MLRCKINQSKQLLVLILFLHILTIIVCWQYYFVVFVISISLIFNIRKIFLLKNKNSITDLSYQNDEWQIKFNNFWHNAEVKKYWQFYLLGISFKSNKKNLVLLLAPDSLSEKHWYQIKLALKKIY